MAPTTSGGSSPSKFAATGTRRGAPESSGSRNWSNWPRSRPAPVYPLLKRADERFVTMQAYDNPVFVEDIVRNVAVMLKKDDRVAWFSVEAVNMESIHNHSAFARVAWGRAKRR